MNPKRNTPFHNVLHCFPLILSSFKYDSSIVSGVSTSDIFSYRLYRNRNACETHRFQLNSYESKLNSSLELQLPRHGTSHRGLQVIPEVLEPLDLALQGLLASHPVFETFGERLETGFSAKNSKIDASKIPQKPVEKVPKSLENGQNPRPPRPAPRRPIGRTSAPCASPPAGHPWPPQRPSPRRSAAPPHVQLLLIRVGS